MSAAKDIRSKSVLLFHERYLKFAEDNLDKQQHLWAVRNWKQVLAAPLPERHIVTPSPAELGLTQRAPTRVTPLSTFDWDAPAELD